MNRLLFAVALAALAGCATRRVEIDSNPPGAFVHCDGMERRTPCTLVLPRGRHEITVTRDPGGESRVIPAPPANPWKSSTRLVSKTGAYVLYAVSAPFIFVGTVSSALLSGVAETGISSNDEAAATMALALVVGAAGGLGIGLPLRAAGEFLDNISDIQDPVVFVDFVPAGVAP